MKTDLRMRLRSFLCLALAVGFVTLPGWNTSEAAFPEREITLICPWPAGGSSDLICRTVAQAAAKHLPKPMVVVNRDGANGVVATTEAKTARPDGYTILQGTSGLFLTQPLTQKNLGYQMDDFDILLGVTNEPILLLVHADSPYKTVDDFIAGAKKENAVIRFANSGTGGIPALTGTYFFQKAGIKSQPIPFKGSAPALTAMLGKHVDAGVVHPGEAIPQIKAGSLRPLIVSSPKRFSALPDVPTMREKGFDIDMGVRKFIFAPKGIPAEVQKALLTALQKSIEEASFKKAMEDAHLMFEPLTGEQVKGYILTNLPIVKRVLEEIPKK